MGRGLDGFLIPVLVGCVVLRVCEARSRTVSGGFGVGETPLPIPNRAVKPHSADGTWPSRAWESRSPPVLPPRAAPPGGSSAFRGRPPPARRGTCRPGAASISRGGSLGRQDGAQVRVDAGLARRHRRRL